MEVKHILHYFDFLKNINVLLIKITRNTEDLDNIINRLDQIGYMNHAPTI